MAVQMISVGEESGELDSMLMKVADFYESEVEQAVKALTSLLEPIMIVVLGDWWARSSWRCTCRCLQSST